MRRVNEGGESKCIVFGAWKNINFVRVSGTLDANFNAHFLPGKPLCYGPKLQRDTGVRLKRAAVSVGVHQDDASL